MSLAQTVVDKLIEADDADADLRRIVRKSLPTTMLADLIVAQMKEDVDAGWLTSVKHEAGYFEPDPKLDYYTKNKPGRTLVLSFLVQLGEAGLRHAKHMADFNFRKWKKSRSKRKGPPPDIAKIELEWQQNQVERLTTRAWHSGLEYPMERSENLGGGLWRVVISGLWLPEGMRRKME